ncbi:MAG: cytochrome C oxidase Cbb3 [Proteobacteria bacterium]|nr:MAG: cytochrome C oxidase Cbb3 [Pseudomonadota bacterium]
MRKLKIGPIVSAAAFTISAASWSAATLAEDQPAAQSSAEQPAKKPFDVKGTFRNICGFCHEDYGRKAGKGPQLMNDSNSDEFLVNRIKNGKPGRMAAFGSVFSDDEIHQIVAFIRKLKPDTEP